MKGTVEKFWEMGKGERRRQSNLIGIRVWEKTGVSYGGYFKGIKGK